MIARTPARSDSLQLDVQLTDAPHYAALAMTEPTYVEAERRRDP